MAAVALAYSDPFAGFKAWIMREEGYKKYLLVLLMVIMAFNLVDRFALGLMLQNIKLDLHLSDTQLGFMSGIAFALFYAVMGLPIARWADTGNRITIISVTAAVWSVMVMLCGRALNFPQLLLIRIGVGVGEAGCIPPAQSLMADYFSRAERPRASAIYQLGVPVSFFIGYFVTGWLNELYGWRTTFTLLGLPGLVLSTLVWLTLKEPRQAEFAGCIALRPQNDQAAPAQPSLKNVCLTLWSKPSFRHLIASFSVMYFFGYGVLQWQPTFFIRSFGLTTGALGTWFALVFGCGGLIGTIGGAYLASRYAVNNESLQMKGIAGVYVGLGVLSIGIYLSPDKYLALALLSIYAIAQYSTTRPLLATIQTLVPERMRATAIALIYLFANLIGMGLGPLAVGLMSDAFQRLAGANSLRVSLVALSPGFLWVAWHLYRAGVLVAADIEATLVPGNVPKSELDARMPQELSSVRQNP